jgi:hypothetical protein
VSLVLGIKLEEQLVDLVAQPCRLGKRAISLADQQAEHRCLVLGRDLR